ncbi:MAG: hypothetical protein QM706_18285 [Nitrospira sp.]
MEMDDAVEIIPQVLSVIDCPSTPDESGRLELENALRLENASGIRSQAVRRREHPPRPDRAKLRDYIEVIPYCKEVFCALIRWTSLPAEL